MKSSTVPPAAPRPDAPPPGGGVADQCWETAHWTSADGTTRTLTDMETAHLWNVLGYLRYYAVEVRDLTVSERQGAVLSLRSWLTDLPIWRAIGIELLSRGEIEHFGGAIELLEAQTSVDWQSAAE